MDAQRTVDLVFHRVRVSTDIPDVAGAPLVWIVEGSVGRESKICYSSIPRERFIEFIRGTKTYKRQHRNRIFHYILARHTGVRDFLFADGVCLTPQTLNRILEEEGIQ